LDGLLGDAGLARSDVAVVNVLRCRPPANRAPRRAEVLACRPFLEAQVRLVDPRVVVLLGSTAVAWGLGPGARLTALRGRAWAVRPAATGPAADGSPGVAHVVADPPITDPADVPRLAPASVLHGRIVLATYHPSAALRFGPNGAPRAALAADLAMAAALLGDRLAA
jgi:DNA polymerase